MTEENKSTCQKIENKIKVYIKKLKDKSRNEIVKSQ